MSDKIRDAAPVAAPTPPPTEDPKGAPEMWAQQLGVKGHVLAGVKHHNRWVAGDQFTATEFEKGLAAFLGEPIL